MNLTQADIDEMRRCAKRELVLRLSVYPKRVIAGKMKQEQADFEIQGMKKIADYFDWLQSQSGNSIQQTLF